MRQVLGRGIQAALKTLFGEGPVVSEIAERMDARAHYTNGGSDHEMEFAHVLGLPPSFWTRASYSIPYCNATEPQWHFMITFAVALREAPSSAAVQKLFNDNLSHIGEVRGHWLFGKKWDEIEMQRVAGAQT